MTGREIMIFNKQSRLALVAKSRQKGGRFQIHLLTPNGLVDLKLELQSFQFGFLISEIEQLDHTPDIHDWIAMIMTANRGYSRGRCSDAKGEKETD